jgi:undecaprenyl-diphosphatase
MVLKVVFVTAALFAILLTLVASKSAALLRLDLATAQELHEYALTHGRFTQTLKNISDVGSTTAWCAILAVTMGQLAYRRLPRLVFFVLVTSAASSVLNLLIKLAVHRARPNLAHPIVTVSGNSFPSGHAQAAIVGYGILLVVFLPAIPRRRRPLAVIAAAIVVLLIGFSRIALGVHYLSDVVSGYLVGSLWLIALVAIFGVWRPDIGNRCIRS